MSKHFIVLNGKRYDAITGALIGPEPTEQHSPATGQKPSAPHTDIRKSEHATAKKSTKPAAHRAQPAHITPHKTQGAKTLMRRVVSKPATKSLTPVKAQYPVSAKHVDGMVAPKQSVSTIDSNRLQRAKATTKSSKVGRFAAQSMDFAPRSFASPAIQPAPVQTQAPVEIVTPTQSAASRLSIFEEALATAKSHETPPPAKARRSHKKGIAIFATVTAVLAIVGVVGYFNRHALEMQVASWRAGFSASAPAYVATGYSQRTPEVKGKSVSINYVSPTDRTSYTVTQEQSDWNSEALLTNIITQYGNTYRTLQNQGRTIFIYGGNKAAWVDGGILYSINGSAPLRTDQIISIAASI